MITDAIGDGWITDLGNSAKLKPLADDRAFRELSEAEARSQGAVCRLAQAASGATVDPDTIFDSQVKRIHEYKRQLLNALRIVVLYNRLRENPDLDMPPRTFFFAGKAAPAYHLAKLISSSSTTWPARSTAIRRCGAGSRSCSCPNTTSRWPSS